VLSPGHSYVGVRGVHTRPRPETRWTSSRLSLSIGSIIYQAFSRRAPRYRLFGRCYEPVSTTRRPSSRPGMSSAERSLEGSGRGGRAPERLRCQGSAASELPRGPPTRERFDWRSTPRKPARTNSLRSHPKSGGYTLGWIHAGPGGCKGEAGSCPWRGRLRRPLSALSVRGAWICRGAAASRRRACWVGVLEVVLFRVGLVVGDETKYV
jgi:hypothetical protein